MKRPRLPAATLLPAQAGEQRGRRAKLCTWPLQSPPSLFPVPVSCYDVFFFFFFFNHSFFPFFLAVQYEAGKRGIQALKPPGIAGWAKHRGVELWNMSAGKLLCLYWLVRPASHLANTISPYDSVTEATLSVKIADISGSVIRMISSVSIYNHGCRGLQHVFHLKMHNGKISIYSPNFSFPWTYFCVS